MGEEDILRHSIQKVQQLTKSKGKTRGSSWWLAAVQGFS